MPRCSGDTERAGDETSAPSTTIVPSDGSMKPAIMRSVVVLPQPEGPSSVTSSPRCSCSETASTTGVAP